MWGATVLRGTRPISPSRISIHAPRVGRDRRQRTRWSRPSIFQSTRPVWGATAIRGARARAEAISIHAPRVGRDKGRGENLVVTLDISIHAPRVGRDCGRHHTDDRAKRFQSTRPVWGATWDQITDMAAAVFQSTRPVWGATMVCHHYHRSLLISIHAPRVGRDATASTRIWRCVTFQSTRPVWGATRRNDKERTIKMISIHAPRVGRDYRRRETGAGLRNFNPRAPCGARRAIIGTGTKQGYFNPRAPCGARQQI